MRDLIVLGILLFVPMAIMTYAIYDVILDPDGPMRGATLSKIHEKFGSLEGSRYDSEASLQEKWKRIGELRSFAATVKDRQARRCYFSWARFFERSIHEAEKNKQNDLVERRIKDTLE